MNNSDYKGLNEGKKQVTEAVSNGIWNDTTTQPNRYSGYVEAIVQLAEEGYLHPEKELNVLDIGASTGKATEGFEKAIEYATDLEVETVSYDLNRGVLKHNQNKQRSGHYVQGNAALEEEDYDDRDRPSFLPFADGSFDIVLSKTLLSRIDGSYQNRAMQEINRVLDEDGVAAVEIDPEKEKRAYKGKERVVKAPLLGQAARITDGFNIDLLELELWAEDRPYREEKAHETADTKEQYGDFDDGAEVITASEPGEQFETDDGAVVI